MIDTTGAFNQLVVLYILFFPFFGKFQIIKPLPVQQIDSKFLWDLESVEPPSHVSLTFSPNTWDHILQASFIASWNQYSTYLHQYCFLYPPLFFLGVSDFNCTQRLELFEKPWKIHMKTWTPSIPVFLLIFAQWKGYNLTHRSMFHYHIHSLSFVIL